jgi:hypothetical protein
MGMDWWIGFGYCVVFVVCLVGGLVGVGELLGRFVDWKLGR